MLAYHLTKTAQYPYPHFAEKKLKHKDKLFDLGGRIRICLLIFCLEKYDFFSFLFFFIWRTRKLRPHISQLSFDKKTIDPSEIPLFFSVSPSL